MSDVELSPASTLSATACVLGEDVLQATLAFIDSFDDLELADMREACRDPAPATKRSPTHSAHRVRAELSSLRSQSAQLEGRLATLNNRQQATASRDGVRRGWEAVALHNRHLRRRAEIRNAKLRLLLDKQARIFKKLDNMLNKTCWDEEVQRIQDTDSARPVHAGDQ